MESFCSAITMSVVSGRGVIVGRRLSVVVGVCGRMISLVDGMECFVILV